MPLRQVLQPFAQRLPAIEGLGNLRGIGARKLKKDVGADGKDRGTHLRRVLIEKLVGRDDRDAKLASLGKDGFNAAVVGDQILDLIAVEGKERPFIPGEKSVLERRENKAAQRKGLFSESSLFEIDNDPITLVHCFPDRKRRMLLPHDVAEVRVGGEGRCLIQDRLPHRRPHRFARLVIAQFEVLPDFGVIDTLEARGPETTVGQEWSDFDEGQPVCREHVKRVPQEFIRPRSEMIEMPALPEDLGEFRDADKVWRFLLQWVQPHGDNRIGGLDENELVAQMPAQPTFLRVNRPHEERRRIAVEIEIHEPAPGLDVLLGEVAEERTLAAPGLPEHRHVHRAPHIAERDVPPCDLSVRHAETKIKSAALVPCFASPSAKAVPNTYDEFFEEVDHLD